MWQTVVRALASTKWIRPISSCVSSGLILFGWKTSSSPHPPRSEENENEGRGIAHICLKQTEYTDEPVSSKSSKTCKSSSVFSVLVHTPLSAFLTPVHPRNLFICLTAKSYLSLSEKNMYPFKNKNNISLLFLTSWPLLLSSSILGLGAKVRVEFFGIWQAVFVEMARVF